MSDIFLSYSKKDKKQVIPIQAALEGLGWEVFRDDDDLVPGAAWRSFIETELKKARCVLVIWSRAAVDSHFVREEAGIGFERRILVPARIEAIRPPFGFNELHVNDLTTWVGDISEAPFRRLVAGIESVIGQAPGSSNRATALATEPGEVASKPETVNKIAVEYRETPPPADPVLARELLENARESDAAEDRLEQYALAREADSSLAEAYVEPSELLIEEERFEEAISLAEVAIERFPISPEAHTALAMAYDNSDDLERAILMYEQAIRHEKARQPTDLVKSSDDYILGTLYWELGDALRRHGNRKRGAKEIATAKRLGYDGDSFI